MVCVSGTNGKTTTSRMLAAIARAAGWTPVHNRAGANLERGVATALLADARWSGAPRADLGLFEVDEASVPRVLRALDPRVFVVTNLFRDQMDRYHELDALAARIGDAIATLPPSAILVLNADDPLVAGLAARHRGTVAYFGVDDPAIGDTAPQAISDATRCPVCGGRLLYSRVVLAHVGDWRCAACRFGRPRRDVAASRVAVAPDSLVLTVPAIGSVSLGLPGVYNAYNALAALTAARALGLPTAASVRALGAFEPAFGRQESVAVAGRRVRLALVKNPAGFDAAVGALVEGGGKRRVLAALNDLDADGRDVSWIWDAGVERLAGSVEHVTVTGTRAADLALRLKYAGLGRERVRVAEGWRTALDAAVAATPPGAELAILATYTAMLALRGALARSGHATRFWED